MVFKKSCISESIIEEENGKQPHELWILQFPKMSLVNATPKSQRYILQ